MTDDDWGCVLTLVVAVAGGAWLFNKYEIKERNEAPAIIAIPKVENIRPTGSITLTTDRDGSIWRVAAGTVSGPRKSRQGWVMIDSSKDKTTTMRESKMLYLVDCGTTATRTVGTVRYDSAGNVASSESLEPKNAKVEYYPPDTLGAAVARELCRIEYGP